MIETVAQTGSTNADLLARIAAGGQVPEGHWLRAECQQSGRGRQGRPWISPEGNLYCSTVVSVREDDPTAHTLSFVAGLACHDMLVRSLMLGAPIMLKWPNDALVGGAKIAGILLERSGSSVVVGVGVNVSHAPEVPGRETTSIAFENPKHDGGPASVLTILAESFAARLQRWRNQPLAATLDAWAQVAHPIGSELTAGDEGSRVTGAFAGLDQEGALLIRLANGALHTIHAGDVSLMAERG
ncbi:MAG: biotin--[acetyl-CoA-carboxylase] ligase [Pseudomonadota bacterium]